jgi:hypothetical protein
VSVMGDSSPRPSTTPSEQSGPTECVRGRLRAASVALPGGSVLLGQSLRVVAPRGTGAAQAADPLEAFTGLFRAAGLPIRLADSFAGAATGRGDGEALLMRGQGGFGLLADCGRCSRFRPRPPRCQARPGPPFAVALERVEAPRVGLQAGGTNPGLPVQVSERRPADR